LPSEVDALSIDNCNIASITFAAGAASVTYTCAAIGANAVTLEVTDDGGLTSTCNATITVADTVSPVVVCQDTTIALDLAGAAAITVADVTATAAEPCGFTSTINTSTFDCTNIGPNVVTLTVTDNNSDVSVCNATVTVIDSLPP